MAEKNMKPTFTTHLLWMVLLLWFPMAVSSSEEAATTTEEEGHAEGENDDIIILPHEGHESEPAHAVLFPVFSLTLGVLIFFILSRFLKALPYTAVMFLVGTLMGITAAVSDSMNQINDSLRMWIQIDSEVLLLVFLPGLIFKDAFGQSVHLFAYSLGQLLIFAFPMVLAGTALTALIGYYIFPYNWSFNLAMTFGSILAATDPVAVAALLEEVGAPPRLKVHVAGESLLNDGSAIVFFSIFSTRYFSEFGIEGFGEEVDVKKGISLFCQKALGGAAAGFFFGGCILVMLYYLNHRFNREENVVQVTAVVAMAYLNYYVSDVVWKTSGVIATVAAGLVVKFMGRAMVNDLKLLEDFLTLVEHLLNTVLFTLGGVVWGAVIVDVEKLGIWGAKDWGYMVLLYVLLHVIRAVSFIAIYPITVRIGLKTNWQETVFQVYGGLRGAVGIALAIALDNDVSRVSGDAESPDEVDTQQLFAMVGGVAFMTLVINGSTAGPLLRKLGLADSTATRQKVVGVARILVRAAGVEDMVRLLTQRRFHHVNFALVAHHIPYMADLTKTQLLQAVQQYKDTTPKETYNPPYLAKILPYLSDDNTAFFKSTKDVEEECKELHAMHEADTRKARIAQRTRRRKNIPMQRFSANNMRSLLSDSADPLTLMELRLIFISTMRSVYKEQIKEGELDDQHVLSVSLDLSLELAEDEIMNGGKLEDWKHLQSVYAPMAKAAARLKSGAKCIFNKSIVRRASLGFKETFTTLDLEKAMTFMTAHRAAEAIFVAEFQDAGNELTEAGKVAIGESQKEWKQAELYLKAFPQRDIALAASHKFCKIILTLGIGKVSKLVEVGMLKESEGEHLIEELEEKLDAVLSCESVDHPGEKEIDDGDALAEGDSDSDSDFDIKADSKDIKADSKDNVEVDAFFGGGK